MRKIIAFAAVMGLATCGLTWGALSNPQSAIRNPQSAEMMAQYLQQLAQPRFEQWRQRYEQLKTPEQIAAYQKSLREQFLKAIGGLPERTPLNPRVTGTIQRDGYAVEKVIFESQPKHYVTALLFLPDAKRFTPPFPGVIVPCGHAAEAKGHEAYQTMGALLALNGMAALVFDPIDQGERSQLPSALPKLQGTTAHTTLGVGSILLGRNTARFEIWDGMRAIDYLQSRPEIDPSRIGCTGNSGGGTQTSYLMALDDRIKAAAPSCYITGFEALLSTIGPQDAEQNIFGQIAFGMDHADYLMMRAPTAILMCAATKDFFDIQGTWTSFRYAKRLYTRLGVPERISLLENDAEHNYNAVQRTGVVRWMARWLLGNDKPITEPTIELLKGDEFRCTPDGQVMHLEGARSTYDLNRDYEKELAAQRKVLWDKTPRADMLNRVRQIAGVRTLAELPEPKVEEGKTPDRNGWPFQQLTVVPEDGIRLQALRLIPSLGTISGAVLCLHEDGRWGRTYGVKPEVTGRVVMDVELRGTGDSQPKRGGNDVFGSDTRDVFTAYLLGRSYVGMRTEDILNCARFLHSTVKGPVDLVAVGHVCVPALHAAALEPQLFGSVKLVRGLVSWSNVVELAQSRNQLVNAVHGALTTYDLPDLVRSLGDRVTIEQPLNALGEPLDAKAASSSMDGPPASSMDLEPMRDTGAKPAPRETEGVVLKKVLDARDGGENLLKTSDWRPFGQGFNRQDGVFACDNGDNAKVPRGAAQTVTLNQTRPEPIVATAWSKAQNVGGSRDNDYALYLDLVYQDGSTLWGQVNAFNAGSHDWEKAQVTIFPEKPVKSVTVNLLLRNHTGTAQFRNAELRPIKTPAGAYLFDGIAVSQQARSTEGFQVRDVAADTAFVGIENSALNLKLECKTTKAGDATFFDVTLSDTSGKDRAVTLIYAVPVSAQQCRWLHDPRETREVEPGREYLNAGRFAAGVNGRLSRYPFAAVANASQAVALGIDMAQPAFFRAGYNAGTEELFLAYDVGLAPERPTAHLRFCKFSWRGRPALVSEKKEEQGQDALATHEFRAALGRYYDLFPESFQRRVADQGLWMPFAKISAVKGWEDFGFRFKEGDNETAWDDQHGIVTFRYTEPMTWWMRMPKDMPRTIEAALAEAKRLATEKKDSQAMALLTSGYHDEQGRYAARLLDTPWCNGAVWSINSMPGVAGDVTDFKNKWGPSVREKLYGKRSMGVPPMNQDHGQDARATRAGDLDGEYIDSSEGYVTDELDFRRDHFAIAQTPLTFSLKDHKPAIFRGLIVFEYIRALAQDVHGMNKLMMANSTPINLCWLAPLLDVMGTETDWNPGGTWRPMSDGELLYRRALCKGKPYCFLMNSQFERFSHEAVEKYMKRSLAYGMFPGFFSHNASQGHYFTRPELYERDRDLFKKYVPLCKLVAEAGWEPITRATSSTKDVHIERFGDQYLTIFNDSNKAQEVTITAQMDIKGPTPELVSGRNLDWREKKVMITLAAEDVAVLRLHE